MDLVWPLTAKNLERNCTSVRPCGAAHTRTEAGRPARIARLPHNPVAIRAVRATFRRGLIAGAQPPMTEATTTGEGTRGRFTIGDLVIEGISIGGQETCIMLPKLDCAFDSGRCPQRAVYQGTVCISHCHMDHIGGIPAHISSRQMSSLPPTNILMPPENVSDVQQLINVYRKLDGSDMPCNIHPLQIGEHHSLSPRHKVAPFKTFHRVLSQGYVLYSIRQKLKPELQGLPGNEIRDRKLAGEEVTDVTEVPELAFTGDTTAEFIHHPDNAHVLTAKVLVMELTFLDDKISAEQAKERGHMHIQDLVDNAHMFQNEAILLIHFSARYREADILAALDARLPADLRRKCIPLLNGFK